VDGDDVVENKMIQSRLNIRYSAFFNLHTKICSIIGDEGYSPFRRLFPNDRLSVLNISTSEIKRAQLRMTKLNEWLIALLACGPVVSNPTVFHLIEKFFNLEA
jgi:hypothetical protein